MIETWQSLTIVEQILGVCAGAVIVIFLAVIFVCFLSDLIQAWRNRNGEDRRK